VLRLEHLGGACGGALHVDDATCQTLRLAHGDVTRRLGFGFRV
jgi:hypothetical protein